VAAFDVVDAVVREANRSSEPLFDELREQHLTSSVAHSLREFFEKR